MTERKESGAVIPKSETRNLKSEITTHSPAETLALAERIGRAAQPGDCVALTGNLGTGKTVMAKGIASGLDIAPSEVTSPTFVLMTRHAGRLTLHHLDAYRLTASAEMLAIGAEEAFYGEGLCVVEWADRVADILPDDRLEIVITVTGETDRVFRLTSTGHQSRRLLAAARA